VKQILWWLIAGSRGGINRARIIMALEKRPYNANQLTQLFGIDYKTVRHHLDVLRKHRAITTQGEDYGTMYFLSDSMRTNFADFLEIWKQVDVPEDPKSEGKNGE
jgi:DNA-binding transcriptional ArsR family regulator